MSNQPKFIDTWKGEIIKAVAVNGAKTWDEIREKTNLSPKNLNIAIRELHDLELITKNKKNIYRVQYDLYKDYTAFYASNDVPQSKVSSAVLNTNLTMLQEIHEWDDYHKEIEINYEIDHFYISGEPLESLSKRIVETAKKEVIMVNPFVDEYHLSNLLMKNSKKGIQSKLITRDPKTKKEANRKKYHSKLKTAGVKIDYKNVHAKIIVVDREVAIISSMNSYTHSGQGGTWEAGIATLNEKIISEIIKSIEELP